MYERMFKELQKDYDILIWNRSLINEKCNGTIYSYDKEDIANSKNPKKIIKYIGFYIFVKKHLQKSNYSKVIFLDTSACTVVLLRRFMKKYYYKKYWIDIRDYSFENIPIYKKMLKKAIDSAYCVDISSRGFLEFLPQINDYCVTHNVDYETIEKVKAAPRMASDKIRISFIGNVRYYELNKQLLLKFKNDDRFLVQFFGTGSEELEKFCIDNKIYNCKFIGRFSYERTSEFYQETDLINNIYGNMTMEVRTALSNKLYYSIYLDKPILVSPNTYISEVVKKYNLGFVVDYDNKNLVEDLYEWYKNYVKVTSDTRKDAIKCIEADLEDYKKSFKSFVMGGDYAY